MKKGVFFTLIIIAVALGAMMIHFNSDSYIKNQNWKYSEGSNIGDWLQKKTFEVKDGIIRFNGNKAKIIFSSGRHITIKNVETQEKGFYVNKS